MAKNSNKMRKEDIIDKSCILDLENQISVLKSTLDLYKKSGTGNENQNSHQAPQSSNDSYVPIEKESMCRHKWCDELKDKIQENRLRMLEMQMMQNMHINNAMHIQMVSQLRTANRCGHQQETVFSTNYLGQQKGPLGQGHIKCI